MGFKDELNRSVDTARRVTGMSEDELDRRIIENDFASDLERRMGVQEERYRLGIDERPSLCFITTAVCDSFGKADDCYELTAFRNFRDKWLVNQTDGKNLIAEYYNIAPKIVDKINSLTNSAEVYKNIWNDYLSKCLNFIESGENSKCKKIYVDMVNTLKEKFLK